MRIKGLNLVILLVDLKGLKGVFFMGKKKDEPIDLNNIAEEDKLKYEIAEELGLLDKVLSDGWKTLSAKETGRIGGLMNKRRHENTKKS